MKGADMKFSRFEEIPVWQAGIELSTRVFALTEDRAFRYRGDIANQLQRAALSIPNNVAEGFERGTTQELITFLYYARGSSGEVRSILCVIERIPAFDHLKSETSDLKSTAESVSRQLRAWADSLQNTGIKGQRYLTDQSRQQYESAKRSGAFITKLREMTEKAAREREEARGKNPKSPT